MSKIFLLLGDSNIRKCVPRLGGHYLTTCDYIPCHSMEELRPALDKITSSYEHVIFSGFTNILVTAGMDSTNDIDRLDAINTSIAGVLALLSDAIVKVPDMSLFVSMPMPRIRPQWYMPLMADICRLVLSNIKSYRTPIRAMRALPLSLADLDSDGVHLNALAGLPYVQGLIDDARALNEIGSGEDPSNTYEYTSSVVVALSATVASHQIQIKQLSDRLLLTACQHAEESCGRVNTDSLNRFVIIGAPYLEQSDQLQSRLKSQVAYFLRAMGPQIPTDIVYVRQFRGRRGAVYDVEMKSVASSSKVRSAYGFYFRRGGNPPPPALSRISITNSLTFASRVRVRLMKEVAKRHKLANLDLNVFVTSYEPRPVLKIKDKKGPVLTFSFCETMQRFSHHLSQEFLVNMTRFANIQIARDDLTPTFLLLSPDLLKGPIPLSSATPDKTPSAQSQAMPQATPVQSTSGLSRSIAASTDSSGRKRKTNPVAKGTSGSVVSKRGKAPIRGRGNFSKKIPARRTIPMEVETVASQGEDTADESIIPIDFTSAVEPQNFEYSED